MAKVIFAILFAAGLSVFSRGSAFAIEDPQTILMQKASSYTSVLETNDVLFIGKFQITYPNCNAGNNAGCPITPVSDAFLGNLVDDDGSCTGVGTSHLRSVAPVVSSAPDLNGYTEGVFGIYLTASEASTLAVSTCPESHALEIEGNPSQFSDVSAVSSELTVEVPRAKALVGPAVLQRAQELESTWGVDLLQSSGTRLNLTGEDYFEQAIPNLQQIAPGIFASGISSPEIHDREFDKSYKSALENFGVGTDMFDNANSSFDALATEWGLPAVFYKLALSILIIGAAVVATLKVTGNAQAAMFAGVLMMPPLALTGLIAFEIVAIITLFSAITIGYLFFLKNA